MTASFLPNSTADRGRGMRYRAVCRDPRSDRAAHARTVPEPDGQASIEGFGLNQRLRNGMLQHWTKRYFQVAAFRVLCAIAPPTVAAQNHTFQSWPEVDAYVQLNSNVRVSSFAALTRENREGSSAEIGPNIDFFFKPLLKLKKITVFQLDQSKARPLMLRLSYRYMPATQGPTEHRGGMEVTGRYPLMRGVLLSDRNRADLRDIDGVFSWRFRNRLTAERIFSVRSFHLAPYLRAEAFYDSRFEKWSRTALTAGSTFPVGKHYEFEAFYEHQNDTGNPPNRQVDGLGVVLTMYF